MSRSYPSAERLPGCVIFRFDAPLFFANARTFREQVRALARPDLDRRWIVVAAEPITDVDTTAAECCTTSTWPSTRTASPRLRRDEGPGAPQDRPVRADPDDRSSHFFPYVRCRDRRVPERDRDGLATTADEEERSRTRRWDTARDPTRLLWDVRVGQMW